jgi:hypothetical protein
MSDGPLFVQTDGLRQFSATQNEIATGLTAVVSNALDAAGVQTSHGAIASAVTTALGELLTARGGSMQNTADNGKALAEKLLRAAHLYDQGDQAAAGNLRSAAEGASTGAAAAPSGGAAGGGDVMGQMVSQLGQQVGQLGQLAQTMTQPLQGLAQPLQQVPQQIMQGVQQAVQQATQAAGGIAMPDVSGPDGAAASDRAERAPVEQEPSRHPPSGRGESRPSADHESPAVSV